jgi:hypothetical protein
MGQGSFDERWIGTAGIVKDALKLCHTVFNMLGRWKRIWNKRAYGLFRYAGCLVFSGRTAPHLPVSPYLSIVK